jgi:hypothetical protein
MHIEESHWEEYEHRFRALAEDVPVKKGPHPEMASSQLLLCLYGDNGLEPEQELAMLSQLEAVKSQLFCVEMSTAYWEDLVLYLPL